MTTRTWNGSGGTTGAAATTANSGGASGDAMVITLAGSGAATYNATNPSITGHKWLRLQATSGTDRARAYHSFPSTPQLSYRAYFRMGVDPGTAAAVFGIIDDSGSFGTVAGLRLTTVSGARHLQLFSGTGAPLLKDYGTLTYGTAGTDEYYADINITKGTGPTDGEIECSIFDDTGTLVDTFSATNVDTGTVNYIRAQWGGNAGVLQDLYVSTIDGNDVAPAALIGPGAAATAPVAAMMARPAPQAPGTVTGTCVFTSSGSTIASTSISLRTTPGDGGFPPDNPTISKSDTGINTASCTTTFSFTGAPGRYLIRGSCVDAGSLASNNSDVYIDVYAASAADVLPYREISGSDTVVGAASEIAAWTDGSASSYTETAAAPVAALEKVEFCSFGPGPIEFKIGGYQNPSSPTIVVTPTVYLANDSTNLPVTPTTFNAPATNTETTISVTNADTVAPPGSARAALILRVSATQ